MATKNPLQMLNIRTLLPTNHKPARVVIEDLRFNERITIPWDYSSNQALDVALDYLKHNSTLKPYGHGLTKDHYFIVIKPVDHRFTSLKQSIKEKQAK